MSSTATPTSSFNKSFFGLLLDLLGSIEFKATFNVA